MKTFPLLGACLVSTFLAGTAAFALDLTPRISIARIEGGETKRYYFDDAPKKVGFRIEREMTVDGSVSEANVRLKGLEFAEMKISKSPLTTVISFSEKAELYRSAARKALPVNATDIVLEQELPDALSINGWKSYQFIFKYNFSGRNSRSSITFLNYNDKEQLVINTGAPVRDYDRVYYLCYRVLNSMYDLRPDEEIKPTTHS